MDNRTIRTAIMRRIPEVTLIEIVRHPTDPTKMVIACSWAMDIDGKPYTGGLENDDFKIGGSHKELMNIVDRMAEELKKYKRQQRDIELYTEQRIESVLELGTASNANVKKSKGGIILLD